MGEIGEKTINAAGGKVERAVADKARNSMGQVNQDKNERSGCDGRGRADEAFQRGLHEAAKPTFFRDGCHRRADYDGADEEDGRQVGLWALRCLRGEIP